MSRLIYESAIPSEGKFRILRVDFGKETHERDMDSADEAIEYVNMFPGFHFKIYNSEGHLIHGT